eukprot:8545394-Pyramimonas_sp.AAC.1
MSRSCVSILRMRCSVSVSGVGSASAHGMPSVSFWSWVAVAGGSLESSSSVQNGGGDDAVAGVR